MALPAVPHEVARRADERPGDDPADPHPLHEHAIGDLAHAIELGHRDHILVRGNLKDAVGRRVDDGPAGPHVRLAEIVEDLCA